MSEIKRKAKPVLMVVSRLLTSVCLYIEYIVTLWFMSCSKYLEKDVSISEEQLVDMARFVSRKLNCHIKGLVQLVFFANTMKSLKVTQWTLCIQVSSNPFTFF